MFIIKGAIPVEGFQEVEGRLRVNFKQSEVSSEKGVVPFSVVRL